MRVSKEVRFSPVRGAGGDVLGYQSELEVEIEGELFHAEVYLNIDRYELTPPSMLDFIHNNLRRVVLDDIRKRLFEGVDNDNHRV
jgi:hypothetical protein